MNKKKLLACVAGVAFLYLILCFNLLTLQMGNIRQADAYMQKGDTYNALFHLGQCLRQKVFFSPYNKLCEGGARQLLPRHPEMQGYIDAHVAATARFGEAKPALTVLMHLGFAAFFVLLFAQIRWDLRRSRRWRAWWWGGLAASLVTWLGIAALV